MVDLVVYGAETSSASDTVTVKAEIPELIDSIMELYHENESFRNALIESLQQSTGLRSCK